MSLYSQRGVSAQKEEVHAAISGLDKGLFPHAFCKISPDYLGGDPDWVNVMHADGAGTKSILAWLWWKETGDLSVWKGIAQDAVVMNLDDLLCTGICDNILFSSTIDRNKLLIPGEILKAIIDGTKELFESLALAGVHIHYLGGETADVGDVVRTIAVNGTMTARWPRARIISNEKIQPGDMIIGLASDGQTTYEKEYNSGIGSNGLTSARHDMLHHHYANAYPQSYDAALPDKVVYIGPYRLQDPVATPAGEIPAGRLLLSPTRTFAPVIRQILNEAFSQIHGMIHSSGGGQTKCLKYLPSPMRIVKDNLFAPPPVFQLIQEASGADHREMYQVFNMGCRMEIYTTPDAVEDILAIAQHWGINARVIGRVEDSDGKELLIQQGPVSLSYSS